MAVAVDGINGWVDGKMVDSFGVFSCLDGDKVMIRAKE